MILLFCGLSGAGKTTLAENVKNELQYSGIDIEIIDADQYRNKLFADLSYTKEDRFENIRRLAFIAGRFASHGILTIISAITPYEEIRQELVTNYPEVKIVHIDCPLEHLLKRDTKGLYAKATLPDDAPDKINNLTGVNDPFEIPVSPDLYINTYKNTIRQCTARIKAFIFNSRQLG
jgi:adenylylsulfate kinase